MHFLSPRKCNFNFTFYNNKPALPKKKCSAMTGPIIYFSIFDFPMTANLSMSKSNRLSCKWMKINRLRDVWAFLCFFTNHLCPSICELGLMYSVILLPTWNPLTHTHSLYRSKFILLYTFLQLKSSSAARWRCD